jgi:parvulin-like peptidyl-prolyl isomerase
MSKNFKIVAKVNDRVITEYDLNNFLNERKIKDRGKGLDLLVENIIKQDAISNENIIFNSEEFKESEIKDKDEYMWTKLLNKVVRPRIILTKSELDDTLEYIGGKITNVRYNISEIMLQNNKQETKNIINKMYDEIIKNNNFSKIAGKFSEVNRDKNGLIGWVNKGEINKVIYNSIKNLQIGQISKPILLDDYYIIIKLNDKIEENMIKTSEINKGNSILYEQRLSLAAKKYYDDLYSNALIERFE